MINAWSLFDHCEFFVYYEINYNSNLYQTNSIPPNIIN